MFPPKYRIRGPSLGTILAQAYPDFQKLIRRAPVENRSEFKKNLGVFLVLLHHSEIQLASGKKINLYRNDSHEHLTGLSRRDATRRARQARLALKRCSDIFSGLPGGAWAIKESGLEEWLDSFEQMLSQTGPQARPDFNRRVGAIVKTVFRYAGNYYDELLAPILDAASPKRYTRFRSADALRAWRTRHGLTGSIEEGLT